MHPHEALIGGSLKWGHPDVQIPGFAPAGFIAFVDAQRLLPVLLPPPNSDESKKFSCTHLAHGPIALPPTLQHTNSPIALLLPWEKTGTSKGRCTKPITKLLNSIQLL